MKRAAADWLLIIAALLAGTVIGWHAHATLHAPTTIVIVHAPSTTTTTTTTIPAAQCHDRLGNPYTAHQCPPPQ